MAEEFLVRLGAGTLDVHALPEPESSSGLVLPVPVLSFIDNSYVVLPTPVFAQATNYGPALLLESLKRPEEDPGAFMDTRVAASAVIEFLTGKPEVAYTVNDKHARHIPDEFLDGMPPELVATVLRVRDPAPPTGMYL